MPIVRIEQTLADDRTKRCQRPDEHMRPQQPAGRRIIVATVQIKVEIQKPENVRQAGRAVSADNFE